MLSQFSKEPINNQIHTYIYIYIKTQNYLQMRSVLLPPVPVIESRLSFSRLPPSWDLALGTRVS